MFGDARDGSGICDKKLRNMKWKIENAASERGPES